MAENSPAPGIVKLFYEGPTGSHIAQFNVKPFVAVGGAHWLNTKNGGPGVAWGSGVGSLVALYRNLVGATVSFLYAELYTIAAPGADPLFVDSTAINLAGQNGNGSQPGNQITWSFRSDQGGSARLVLLDVAVPADLKGLPPAYGAFGAQATNVAAVVNFARDPTSWLFARDDGALIAATSAISKQNDALRAKRLRL